MRSLGGVFGKVASTWANITTWRFLLAHWIGNDQKGRAKTHGGTEPGETYFYAGHANQNMLNNV
jgi:hypothetical protein